MYSPSAASSSPSRSNTAPDRASDSVQDRRASPGQGSRTRPCAGASDRCNGQVFNVGGLEPISHKDLVALLIDVAGAGSVRYVPWPTEKKAIDIGSFYADSSRFRNAVGWEPLVTLRDGFVKTLAYYRAHADAYLDDSASTPSTVA